MQRVFGVICVASLMLIATTSQANFVQNGSFEDPALADNTWSVFDSISGWTKTFGSGIEVQNNVAGSSYVGKQHVELDSHDNSGMKQTITTAIGQLYELSFAFSPRPNRAASTNGIDVYWDGGLLDSMTGDGAADTVWTIKKYNVLADKNLTDLEFQAVLTSDSYGGYVDDVRLIAIPEASSVVGWSLLGIVSAGTWRWRKRRAR